MAMSTLALRFLAKKSNNEQKPYMRNLIFKNQTMARQNPMYKVL